MIYLFDESIPTDVSPDFPKRYELDITLGLVYRVEISFPPGSFGLAGVRVFDGSFQLWPSSPGKWFRGDNVRIDFDDLYLKDAKPSVFLVEAYNRDTQWEHTIFVRVGITTKKAFQARYLPTVAYEYYHEMLQRIREEQEEEKEKQRQRILEEPLFFGGS